MSGTQKEKKRKMKEVGRARAFNPKDVNSARGRGTCNTQGNNFLHSCDQKEQSAIRTQTPNAWRTYPDCPPLFPQVACKLLQEYMHGSLPWAGGWQMGSFSKLKPGIDQSCLSLPLAVASLKQTLEFQNSYIRQILPMSLLSRWGDIFQMFLTPTPSPNPPP